jgi:hypothetical protein
MPIELEPPDNPIFAADAALECVSPRTASLTSGLIEGPAAAPVIPEALARMASPNPQPAVARDGTAGVKKEREKGLERSTSSLERSVSDAAARTAGKQHPAIRDLAARLASLPPEAIAALQALFGGPPERPKNSG